MGTLKRWVEARSQGSSVVVARGNHRADRDVPEAHGTASSRPTDPPSRLRVPCVARAKELDARLTFSCTSVGRELPIHRPGPPGVRERGWSDRNAEGERGDDAGRECACETGARAVVRLGGSEARERTRSFFARRNTPKSHDEESTNFEERVTRHTWDFSRRVPPRGRRHIERHAMTRTMQRAVALFAALALASVCHADAACATTQTFKQLQPSVRAWKKDTFSNVAHDTPILEGTTARVAERVSRTGLPTLTSYPRFFSPLPPRSKPASARTRTRWSGSPRKTERCARGWKRNHVACRERAAAEKNSRRVLARLGVVSDRS